jgi:signal peptidase I
VSDDSKQTAKKARAYLKEVERLLQKHAPKIDPKDQEKLVAAMDAVRAALDGQGDKKNLKGAIKELDARVDQTLGFAKKSPTREYGESIIIAIVIAVVLRAFVLEAFKIPTGSMIPTLAVGDHIFVNKFIYGLRVPFTNAWFVEWGTPERGDVIVFRYPRDLSKDYIKRVVGVAGDKIHVVGQEVFVNGQKLERQVGSSFEYIDEGEDERDEGRSAPRQAVAYAESSRGTDLRYTVIYEHHGYSRPPWPHGDNLDGLDCRPETPEQHGECTVKPGYVFVMGDNRDNSSDSRVWGGVPNTFVKGKAMFIWWSRGPRSGVRFDRMGSRVH